MVRQAFDSTVAGQKVELFSDEYNAFIQAALAHIRSILGNGVPGNNDDTKLGIVNVENVSGQDVDQYNYMVVEDFLFQPADNEDSFRNNATFTVNIYDSTNEDHIKAPIVILQEPLQDSQIGLAMVSGSTQVRVDIVDIEHTCFTRKSGSTILTSSTGGYVSSIFKESFTGEAWAYGEMLGNPTMKQFVVIGLQEEDIVTCRALNDGQEGSQIYKIALPYLTRRKPFDNGILNRDGFTYQYSSFDTRVSTRANDPDDVEDQIITPPYVPGDIIYAARCIDGGTEVFDSGDLPVEWLDLNDSSRAFMLDADAEDEE